jgi:xanthine dehydrogenase YagS FAD-binding subunit
MKPFKHESPVTIEEAVAKSNEYKGNAPFIAGGTDILGPIKDRIHPTYPDALIDLKKIPGLDYIKEEGGVLKIGALTSLTDVAASSTVQGSWSILAMAAGRVSAPELRNMGTIGGNLCQEVRCWFYRYPNRIGGRIVCLRKGGTTCFAVTGDNRYHSIIGGKGCFAICPSDTAIALTALDATIVTNKRSIAIADFYKVLGTALASDEIVKEIQVPKPAAGTVQNFIKHAMRPAIDFAMVSVATVISGSDARIVLGAVAPVPYRATAAEDVVKGKTITETLAAAAGEAAVKDAVPLDDNKYKVQIAKVLVKRCLLGQSS